jgi:hypothetical protein
MLDKTGNSIRKLVSAPAESKDLVITRPLFLY